MSSSNSDSDRQKRREPVEVSSRSAKMLKKAFYDENNMMGRDSLFYILKKQYPKTHPTEDEIETWLKRRRCSRFTVLLGRVGARTASTRLSHGPTSVSI